jgi:hypothetical protein
MKSLSLICLGILALLTVACTHTLKVQIEDVNGQLRYYETYPEAGGHDEILICNQSNVGHLVATYNCDVKSWQ